MCVRACGSVWYCVLMRASEVGGGWEDCREGLCVVPAVHATSLINMFQNHVQDFDTVMAALGSNNERWGINDVTLELQRPTTAGAAAAEEGSS